jgi:hypothetical protein
VKLHWLKTYLTSSSQVHRSRVMYRSPAREAISKIQVTATYLKSATPVGSPDEAEGS